MAIKAFKEKIALFIEKVEIQKVYIYYGRTQIKTIVGKEFLTQFKMYIFPLRYFLLSTFSF